MKNQFRTLNLAGLIASSLSICAYGAQPPGLTEETVKPFTVEAAKLEGTIEIPVTSKVKLEMTDCRTATEMMNRIGVQNSNLTMSFNCNRDGVPEGVLRVRKAPYVLRGTKGIVYPAVSVGLAKDSQDHAETYDFTPSPFHRDSISQFIFLVQAGAEARRVAEWNRATAAEKWNLIRVLDGIQNSGNEARVRAVAAPSQAGFQEWYTSVMVGTPLLRVMDLYINGGRNLGVGASGATPYIADVYLDVCLGDDLIDFEISRRSQCRKE